MSHPRLGLALALVLGIAGCSIFTPEPPLPPDYNFAAHRDDDGLTIDRMEGGQKGVLKDADCPLFCKGPQLLLVSAGETQAAFWLSSPSTVVRRAAADDAPLLGKVESSWENAAIRFSLEAHGAGSYQTGIFQRIDGGFASMALGQPVQLTLDLTGVYRADVVDDHGAKVGWLRVRVASVESPTRIYEGVLPPAVNGPLAVAAVAQLDATIGAVLANATNPFLGN